MSNVRSKESYGKRARISQKLKYLFWLLLVAEILALCLTATSSDKDVLRAVLVLCLFTVCVAVFGLIEFLARYYQYNRDHVRISAGKVIGKSDDITYDGYYRLHLEGYTRAGDQDSDSIKVNKHTWALYNVGDQYPIPDDQ